MDAIATELHSMINEERGKMRTKRSLFQNFLFVAAVCSVFFFVFHYILGVVMVQGTSMGSTIAQNSVVFYNKLAKGSAGDIVIAKHDGKLLIKRQIAAGGQTVDIVGGKVSVDGKLLNEDYLSSAKTSPRDVVLPYTVPEGHVFILGDNRAASVDSRNSQIGSIDSDNIVGKIIFVK